MDIPRRIYREYNKIGVFLDFGDCQIPVACDPRKLSKDIETKLESYGYQGESSVWAYRENNTIPDDLMRGFTECGIMFKPDVPGDKHARVKKLLVDILLFALDNPSGNLLVVSESDSDDFDGDTVFFSVLSALQARKYVALLGWIDWTESALWTSEGDWTKKHCSKRIDDTSVVRGSPLVTGNGLFWDVHDYPIPGGISAESIYMNLGSSLCDKSRTGDVSIWAYGERQTFPAHADPHSRFKLGFVPDGENYPRGFKMLLDMLFWALDNFELHDEDPTLMVLSKDISEEADFTRVVQALVNRHYDVRVSDPDKVPSGVLRCTESSKWLWTCLFDGEKLIVQSGSPESAEGTNTAAGGFWRFGVYMCFGGYGESS